MNRRKWIMAIILGLVLFSLAAMSLPNGGGSLDSNQGKGGPADNVIAVVRIEGVITNAGSADLFGNVTSGGTRLQETLREIAQDPKVKAVVLRINSPGGSAAAAQEIGDQIDGIRQAGKIVVASMGEMAASGGYWLAAKSDKIVANPATMTGSIGVIMELAQMTELFNKIGYEPRVFKSGPHKDMGSPNREMTEEERQIFQSMIDDIYSQFVEVVVEGRKIPREKVLQLADGRIYTGRQALEAGLVDQLGNFYDAVEVAQELAGISGEPNLQEYDKTTPWERFFGGLSQAASKNQGLSVDEIGKMIQGLSRNNALEGGLRP